MARKSGDAERAPLLATTERVDCELGNGTVDREEEGARRERGRGRWVTKGRAAWVLGGCAVVAGAAACALGTRANGGSLMTWKSALGTKRENAAARRRARAVRSRREAARERRAEERRALEDHANDVLREIAREASPEDARRMVEEAIRRVEITKKSEAFAHAYDMARLGDEELVDDLEVDPHTIMDPKEFAKLTVDEKNALRRRMRTALRKVREELKTNAPSSARAKGQAAARRPGANVAAANASAAKRRRDAADANVRAKGEEKRKEISNDAEKLIQEIREGVEKTSSALREAAKEEGTKEAADKAADKFLSVHAGENVGKGALGRVEDAVMDLVEDEKEGVRKAKSLLRWDHKRRKYVRETLGQSGIPQQWVRASGVSCRLTSHEFVSALGLSD